MINFAKHRKWYFLFSGIVIAIGLVAMFISTQRYPQKSIVLLSVDFVGGSLFEVKFSGEGGKEAINNNDLEAIFSSAGLTDVAAQRLGLADDRNWQVRTNFIGNDNALVTKVADGLDAMAKDRNLTFDRTFFVENKQSVSPTIGGEVTTAAVIATLVASAIVMAFIALAFRMVKHSFRYGVCALLAMLHDVIVMVGAMSIFGLLLGWEADALFLTGLLTVVGYSVQDTIVMFDRIRENETRHRGEPYEMIVDRSVMETVQRSLMTQIAVAFVLLSLFLIGGGAIRQFVGVLLVGLISGTYSSIFVAVPLLVSWDRGELPFVNRRAHKNASAA